MSNYERDNRIADLERGMESNNDAIIRIMARLAKLEKGVPVVTYANITKTEEEIRADEREKWAKWCDRHEDRLKEVLRGHFGRGEFQCASNVSADVANFQWWAKKFREGWT